MPNEELLFALDRDYHSTPHSFLGIVHTDSMGRFGFAYNIGVDPVARRDMKI